MAKIEIVSFDLWDTLVVDDSDEPKRRARGLLSKKEQRRELVWRALSHARPLPRELVDVAYDVTDAAFNKAWHDEHVTWSVRERLKVLLKGLGRTLAEQKLAELVEAHESMEVEIPPDPMPGVSTALHVLEQRYRLCIISDAIVTPGHRLRGLLQEHGIGGPFQAMFFSDEVGRSKPHQRAFLAAAKHFGVEPSKIVHVGDRQSTDVAGAQALGCKAILFCGSRTIDRGNTTADAVCEHMNELPAIVDSLAERA